VTKQFIAALVGAPFGVKGQVKVRPFSGEVEHLLKLESIIARQSGKERILQIEESAAQPPGMLIKFAGFDSPEAVKELQGAELLVSREQAAALEPDEFYVEDLRGIAVLDKAGGLLGHITDIIEGGGGELAEIKLPGGELKLAPFRKEFFVEINLEKGQAVLANHWVLE
jgi:16S rRNA processing protein RimM